MAHCPNGPVFSLACGRWLPRRDDSEISRSLRSEQARGQRPDRFREGYLVNINLRSDVSARGNSPRIYGYDICIYASPDVPSSFQRANIVASRVWFMHHLRNETFMGHRAFIRESFVDIQVSTDSDSESVRHKRGNMRDRCASCKIYVIS